MATQLPGLFDAIMGSYRNGYEYSCDSDVFIEKATGRRISRMELENAAPVARKGATSLPSLPNVFGGGRQGGKNDYLALRGQIVQELNSIPQDQWFDHGASTKILDDYKRMICETSLERSLRNVDAIRHATKERYTSNWNNSGATPVAARDSIHAGPAAKSVAPARPARRSIWSLLCAPIRRACRLCGRNAAPPEDGGSKKPAGRFSEYF